jgi:hypothetical protein
MRENAPVQLSGDVDLRGESERELRAVLEVS